MTIKPSIYKIINSVNGKIYVGSAQNTSHRWYIHKKQLKDNLHHNIHLQRSWNKYGEENFKCEPIEIIGDVSLLIEREQFYIDTLNPEYNICKKAFSCRGIKRSIETINKKKEWWILHRETYVMPEYQREAIVKAASLPKTLEHKKKIGAAHKGKHVSLETREKVRAKRLGTKRSIESILKQQETRKAKRLLKNNYIPLENE